LRRKPPKNGLSWVMEPVFFMVFLGFVEVAGAAVAVEFQFVAGDSEAACLEFFFFVAVVVHMLEGAVVKRDSFVAA